MYAFPSVKLPPKAIEEREMLKTLAETVIFGALLTVKIMFICCLVGAGGNPWQNKPCFFGRNYMPAGCEREGSGTRWCLGRS